MKILKTFSSQGNQGKTGVFSQNQGKNFEIRELLFQNHFQPFYHFNPRKKTFLSGEVLLLGSVSVINRCFCKHYPNGKCEATFKKNKYDFFD